MCGGGVHVGFLCDRITYLVVEIPMHTTTGVCSATPTIGIANQMLSFKLLIDNHRILLRISPKINLPGYLLQARTTASCTAD